MLKISANEWLKQKFAEVNPLHNRGNMIRAAYIKEWAERDGIPWRSVQRAKNRLGILSVRPSSDGPWWWVMSGEGVFIATVTVHVLAKSEEQVRRILPQKINTFAALTKTTVIDVKKSPTANWMEPNPFVEEES